MAILREIIELSARVVEILAVSIILLGVTHGTVQYLTDRNRHRADAYERYKVSVGQSLLLGLEFLVAADVVETVALERTLNSVVVLAVLVLVRTFLSWSLVVEIEGRWPWRPRPSESGS
jgi:uncharacterized membrane protein